MYTMLGAIPYVPPIHIIPVNDDKKHRDKIELNKPIYCECIPDISIYKKEQRFIIIHKAYDGRPDLTAEELRSMLPQ